MGGGSREGVELSNVLLEHARLRVAEERARQARGRLRRLALRRVEGGGVTVALLGRTHSVPDARAQVAHLHAYESGAVTVGSRAAALCDGVVADLRALRGATQLREAAECVVQRRQDVRLVVRKMGRRARLGRSRAEAWGCAAPGSG